MIELTKIGCIEIYKYVGLFLKYLCKRASVLYTLIVIEIFMDLFGQFNFYSGVNIYFQIRPEIKLEVHVRLGY